MPAAEILGPSKNGLMVKCKRCKTIREIRRPKNKDEWYRPLICWKCGSESDFVDEARRDDLLLEELLSGRSIRDALVAYRRSSDEALALIERHLSSIGVESQGSAS